MVIRRFASVIILLLALIGGANAYGPSGGGGTSNNVNGPVSIIGTQGNGADLVNNVSINGVQNIKAFGASGSNKSISCVANGTQTLDCSGGGIGDFAVGQSVKVREAGANPVNGGSAQPTATVSCTGTGCGETSKTANDGVCTAGSQAITSATISFANGDAGREITIACGAAGANINTRIYQVISATKVIVTEPANNITTQSSRTFTMGVHTYAYKVLSCDSTNWPNEACAAPSTASANATAPILYGTNVASGPSQKITLGNYSVGGASWYVICRSTDSATYVFVGVTSSTGYVDVGGSIIGNKTLDDFGLPSTTCTGSSTVPRSVFGKISAISGTNITIAANGTVNGGATQGADQSTTAYPSTIAQSATVSLEHDDTPAFFSWRNKFIGSNCQSAVYFPAGDYNINAGTPGGNYGAFNLVGCKNVQIYGDGTSATRIHLRGNRTYRDDYVFWISSGFNVETYASNSIVHSSGTYTTYNLYDPGLKNQSTVLLTSPPAQNTFAANDPVSIYVDAAGYFGVDWYETNEVVSYDATSGKLVLKYPLNKTYSATALAAYNNVCAHPCVGQPVIANAKMGTTSGILSAQNIYIHDISFDGGGPFWLLNQAYQVKVDRISADLLELGNEGVSRFVMLTNSRIVENRDANAQGFVSAAGSSDMIATNNDFVEANGTQGQNCDEGSARDVFDHNRIYVVGAGGVASYTTGILNAGGCFDSYWTNNLISASLPASAQSFMSPINSDPIVNLVIDGNNMVADTQAPQGNSWAAIGQQAINALALGSTVWGHNNTINITNPSNNQVRPALLKTTAPDWATDFGDGNEGGFNNNGTLSGEHEYTSFECTGTISAGNRNPLVIRATQYIQLDAACALNFNNVASGQGGFLGGAGGGGGGGAAGGGAVTNLNSGYWLGQTALSNLFSAGAAGGVGANGSIGNSVTGSSTNAGKYNGVIYGNWPASAAASGNCGGASGSAGGSAGGAGGNGGSCVILIAPTIIFQTGATINVDGGDGGPSTAASVGAGGGGGGGLIFMAAQNYIGSLSNTAMTANGGSGGSCFGTATVPSVTLHGGYAPSGSVLTATTGAYAHVSVIAGAAPTTMVVDTAGSGYTNAPTCSISGGGGSGATCTCTLSSGTVNACTASGGTGYTNANPTTVNSTCGTGGFGGNGTIYQTYIQP